MKIRYILLGVVVCAGLGGLLLFPHEPALNKPEIVKAAPKKQPKQISLPTMAQPAQLSIPSLDIIAPVERVGLTATGDMDVPSTETILGWYEAGAFPGNPGPAVLAGHTGRPATPSPFRKLEQLTKDAVIEIRDSNGIIASFTVSEIATYTPETAPRERIFGPTTASQLVIITCSGDWNERRQTYSHRLVIYSTRSS